MKNKIAFYLRSATEQQSTPNIELENQEREIKSYIVGQKINIDLSQQIKIFQDTGSGLNFKRLGLTNLLKDVTEKKVNSVMIASLDRLSRNPRHLMEILRIFHDSNC